MIFASIEPDLILASIEPDYFFEEVIPKIVLKIQFIISTFFKQFSQKDPLIQSRNNI